MSRDHQSFVIATPFRTVPAVEGRTRTFVITEARRSKAVSIETHDKDGRLLAGRMILFPHDLPAFIGALTDAAAAIGVEIPAAPEPQPDNAALSRNLVPARAH